MRLVIFGATGRMGHLLVDEALAAGHEVVAYARDPDKMKRRHPRLSVVAGGLDDEAAIRQAVTGGDAVIEGVGAVSEGTARIVAAMQTAGVSRLVVVSTCSVDDDHDRPDKPRARLVRAVRLAIPRAYREVRRAAEIVRASGLDWTLVRVARLNNDPGTAAIKVGYFGYGEVGLSISRADMATFLLDQASDRRYLQAAPAISN